MLPILPTDFTGFTITCNFFQFVLKHPRSWDIYVIFLITKDQILKIIIIIKISEPGVDFLSVLPMACMHLEFLTYFQKRQLKKPSSTAICNTCSTRAKKESNQAYSFILVLEWKQFTGPKPTGRDQVSAWGQSRTEHPKTRGEKKKRVRKRRKIWCFSKVILLWPLVSWTVRLPNSTGIRIILQLMKAHLQIKLDNIKTHVTFCLLILLLLFLEQSHSWHEKRRYYCSRKHVTIKCWLEKDCLVLMEPETTLSIINCNYIAS